MGERRIFVTGATGFLGREVLRRLRSHPGVEAVAVTRQRGATFPSGLAVERVANYADLTSRGTADVIHLAEAADMAVVQRDPDAILQAARNTIAVLVARFDGRVVYGSSAAVYGDESTVAHEAGEPLPEGGGYVRMKRESEARVRGAGGTVLRLSNILGYREHDISVIGDILRQLDQDGPLRVHRLTPVRDYLAVGDAAEAIVTATFGAIRGCFNVGSGRSRSVGEVVAAFLSAAGQAERRVEETRPSKTASVIRLDIARTIEALQWRPRTRFEDAVTNIIGEHRRKSSGHG